MTVLVACGALVMGAYLWFRLKAFDAPILIVVLSFALWLYAVELLGRPRPAGHDLFRADDVVVLSHVLDEGNAIYVWVAAGDEPIAYRLPWDLNQAKKLRQAAQQAQGQHTGLRMRRGNRFAPGEWQFYPEPVQALPPKD